LTQSKYKKIKMQDRCRRCGSISHSTPLCPNVHREVPAANKIEPTIKTRVIKNSKTTKTVAAQAKASSRDAARADLAHRTAVKMAIYQELLPYGVLTTASKLYTKYNWDIVEDTKCSTCGWARPKGCLCFQ
jgi:ribosomal protein L37E